MEKLFFGRKPSFFFCSFSYFSLFRFASFLSGSNGVALSTAFGHYLRYYTFCDFHWENGGGNSFDTFPPALSLMPVPASKERITFLSHYRYYQNTCTASYSYAWKTWKQWEEDIDWMVMSGINLPLAFTGQEIVWKKLWESYGVSEEGLQQYFTGPAFLTWQRMANIRAFAGPLSENWILSQGIVVFLLFLL
jgi:alpha-N-acetylglucosaminidase